MQWQDQLRLERALGILVEASKSNGVHYSCQHNAGVAASRIVSVTALGIVDFRVSPANPMIPRKNTKIRPWWVSKHRNEFEKVVVRISEVNGCSWHPRKNNGLICRVVMEIERRNSGMAQCVGGSE